MTPITSAALVGLTLMVCGAVATLPAVVRERIPRPQPVAAGLPPQEVWIVRGPQERWFVDGRPLSGPTLGALLRRQPPGTQLHLLPAAGLSSAEVAASLRWLRGLRGDPVRLELGGGQP
jgi:hypothetical protein